MCRLFEWERKHAIKTMNRPPPRAAQRRGGPRPRYGPEVVALLKGLWFASGQLCGKRLQPVLEPWLRSLELRDGPVDEEVGRKVLTISAAQIDRLLSPSRARGTRRMRPECTVRSQVPLRTGPWEAAGPG